MQVEYINQPTPADLEYFSAYAAELLENQPEDFDPLEFVDDSWED